MHTPTNEQFLPFWIFSTIKYLGFGGMPYTL
jgi:hypothetical protein